MMMSYEGEEVKYFFQVGYVVRQFYNDKMDRNELEISMTSKFLPNLGELYYNGIKRFIDDNKDFFLIRFKKGKKRNSLGIYVNAESEGDKSYFINAFLELQGKRYI